MIGPLAACVIALTPAPVPDHATDLMAAAIVARHEEAIAEAAHERFHCLEDLNGPYVRPPLPAAATVQVKPRTLTQGVEQWRSAVAAYGWPVDQALAVMACESGGNPSAYNPSGATGLFQIKPFWLDAYPGDLFNGGDNIRIAYQIWANEGGWAHWVCRP